MNPGIGGGLSFGLCHLGFVCHLGFDIKIWMGCASARAAGKTIFLLLMGH
jgi:hypothetical protein